MSWGETVKRGLCWAGGITLTALWYIFAEGWLILVVKFFGFVWGTVIVTAVTLALAWIVLYVSSGSRSIGRFRDWLLEKEKELSGRAKAAVKGGQVLAIANTAVFLGPMVAAVLMLMLGIDRKRIYFYLIPCSLLCAVVWCGLYSGIFWEIHRIMAGKL
ncbi:MAG: hypothetical protein PHE61_05940 [Candidatus Omnitrophica bacterium]|nr:hypothetical protein [Candidatus Omnitrophota bacterium]